MAAGDFLARLRDEIQRNDGQPPGEQRFYRSTGLSRDDLWAAGFASYGEACKAVGSEPNLLRQRYTDDDVLRPLAELTRRLGRFPAKGAAEVERKRDPRFPSWEAIKSRERRGPESSIQAALSQWCKNATGFEDVIALLGGVADKQPPRTSSKKVIAGYVYLMRYGSGGTVFKIGCTDNVLRRNAQINSMAPQDVRVIHSIPTDDPEGIERYWLARFADKRVDSKNELFRLSPEDVVAFRSRAYM